MTAIPSGTKERILREALRLFNVRGFNGTGVADIQKAAKVKRGSLYFHFPSKDALAAEALKTFFDSVGAALARELQGPLTSPLDSLFGVFAVIRDNTIRDGFQGGCLLGTFGQEVATQGDPGREKIRDYFERLIDAVTVFMERSRQAGETRGDLDARGAARLFVSAFHGALIELRVYRDRRVYDEAMDALRVHLTGASGEAR